MRQGRDLPLRRRRLGGSSRRCPVLPSCNSLSPCHLIPQVKETASVKDAAAPKLAWKAAAAPAGAPAGVACREVTLPKPLAKKGTAKLTALAAYTHVLRPEPAEVRELRALGAELLKLEQPVQGSVHHDHACANAGQQAAALRDALRYWLLKRMPCYPKPCRQRTVADRSASSPALSLPSQARQRDAQHVLFEATAQLASPYKVAKQSTEVGRGSCRPKGLGPAVPE